MHRTYNLIICVKEFCS